ncbi:MAG: saccharopine dehydrogenase C-terminal domain-containing protein, partial [Phycisphaerales bacterium]|nr:saccharopine dehydrogenase C-terminal domain-containing protein [Phycisphaerales bacterium]
IARLGSLVKHPVPCEYKTVDVSDINAVKALLKGHDSVICMLPFNFVIGIAEAANELGVNYFDVTEDVETTDKVKSIADSGRAKVALVPQCGLAPGYIAIAAHDVARSFKTIDTLVLRVGALPQYPTNRLKYNVTWSAAGVINEYCEPCNVMLGGKGVKVPALGGVENFTLNGCEYEAFFTSGGIGSLIESLVAAGKTIDETTLAYKSIRYPGHAELMKFLLQDLRLGEEHATPTRAGRVFDRALAVDLLEHGCARTTQDVVVVFVTGIGIGHDGVRRQINFGRTVPATEMFGRLWPAIELTTAAGVCAMLDLHRLGKTARSGFIKQEDVSLEMFNETIFGLGYEGPHMIEAAVAR